MAVSSNYCARSLFSVEELDHEQRLFQCLGIFSHTTGAPRENRLLKIEIYQAQVHLHFSDQRTAQTFKAVIQANGCKIEQEGLDPLSHEYLLTLRNLQVKEEFRKMPKFEFPLAKSGKKVPVITATTFDCLPLLRSIGQTHDFANAESGAAFEMMLRNLTVSQQSNLL